MTYEALRSWLGGYDGPSVRTYARKVISDTRLPIYGIPLGALRRLAKTLPLSLLGEARWDSFEEVLALGLAVAYSPLPFARKLPYLRQVLPRLDSWAHTDSIVPTLKLQEPDRQAAWAFALECMESNREYTIRFGIVMLMDHFLETSLPQVLQRLTALRDARYYVRMAAAWCLAEAAVKQPQPVLEILENRALDPFIHNKAIQKMRESYRINQKTKAAILPLKRKEAEQ